MPATLQSPVETFFPIDIFDEPKPMVSDQAAEFWEAAAREARLSNYIRLEVRLKEAAAALGRLRRIDQGLATIPPTPESIERAESIFDLMRKEKLPPSRVAASAEGGVAICFERSGRYADIEFFNDGDIGFVMSDRQGRIEAEEIADEMIGDAIARICRFLAS